MGVQMFALGMQPLEDQADRVASDSVCHPPTLHKGGGVGWGGGTVVGPSSTSAGTHGRQPSLVSPKHTGIGDREGRGWRL